jgi:uncharacterized protein (DUF58 family)
MRRTVTLPRETQDPRQFEVDAKRLADSLNFGQKDSAFHGAGVEYAQSRPYAPGDAVKSIDWRVSARTGKLFVKEFHETRQMPLYLLLDTSASMCVSSLPLSKYAWAVRIATGIALAAQAETTPVGMLGCGGRALHVSPSLSRTCIFAWAHALRRHDFLEETSVSRRVRELAPFLPRRTLVFVFSDLHDPGAVGALQALGQRHDVAVFHLQDPSEERLAGSGIFRGVEAESGRAFVGHGGRRWVDSGGWKDQLTRFGVDYLALRTAGPILTKVREFLRQRARGGRAAR